MAESITIALQTGNAAFEDAPASEIARILRAVAKAFEDGKDMDGATLRDINGNPAGRVFIARHTA